MSYFDQFGKHNVNLMVGHEWYDTKTTYLYAYAQGVFSPAIPEINGAANKASSNSYTSEYNVEGFFANLQYNYDDRYFASASFRRDASSRFHKDNRWGNFWSVGGAWLINKEEWFNASWVTDNGYESGMYEDHFCFVYVQYFVSASNLGYGYDFFIPEE